MLSKWFRKQQTSLTSSQPDTSLSAIVAYCELMARYPTAILDETMLPRPKREMKLLLIAAWALEKDAERPNALEIGFIGLSNFQEGVGSDPIDCQLPSEADPAAVIQILKPWLAYSNRVNGEAAALLAELNDLKKRETAA